MNKSYKWWNFLDHFPVELGRDSSSCTKLKWRITTGTIRQLQTTIFFQGNGTPVHALLLLPYKLINYASKCQDLGQENENKMLIRSYLLKLWKQYLTDFYLIVFTNMCFLPCEHMEFKLIQQRIIPT